MIKLIVKFLLLLPIVLILNACGAETSNTPLEAETTETETTEDDPVINIISGVVTDVAYGTPISGVDVRIGNIFTETDIYGSYSLHVDNEDSYLIEAYIDDYHQYTYTLPDSDAQTIVNNIDLVPLYLPLIDMNFEFRNALTGEYMYLDSVSIQIDGTDASYFGGAITDIEIGIHEIQISAEGYDTNIFSARLTPDDNHFLVFMMPNNEAEVTNSLPVANAGDDQIVYRWTVVTLNGSSSFDPEGEDITYQWSGLVAPKGSEAILINTNSAYPSFSTDVVGTYSLDLIVNDGYSNSISDTVVVHVTNEYDSSPFVGSSLYSSNIYLGCWICSDFQDDAIRVASNQYGSPSGEFSIRNHSSLYGSSDSNVSACNVNATAPPSIFDVMNYPTGVVSVNPSIASGICNPTANYYSRSQCSLLNYYCEN